MPLDNVPSFLRREIGTKVDESRAERILHASPVHLGSYAHERWAVQREVLAVTKREVSVLEAAHVGLVERDVVCWHYGYWKNVPAEKKRRNRVLCFFHHHLLEGFADPQVVAAVCMNDHVRQALESLQPDKPVWRVHVGGSRDAVPHARRTHASAKLRLLLAGNAEAGGRKGAELVPLIAERLDKERHAWVFVGPGWEGQAQALRADGWTVITPGRYLPGRTHYAYFGEGDVYLMLSRLEGGPLTLLETMGLGIWPVCTRTGLAPDLIRHGVDGHLVSAYDGHNGARIAREVGSCVRTLDRPSLAAAKPRVRKAVRQHTHRRFRREMARAIEECFDA